MGKAIQSAKRELRQTTSTSKLKEGYAILNLTCVMAEQYEMRWVSWNSCAQQWGRSMQSCLANFKLSVVSRCMNGVEFCNKNTHAYV